MVKTIGSTERIEYHLDKARIMIQRSKDDSDFKGSWSAGMLTSPEMRPGLHPPKSAKNYWLWSAKQHVNLAQKAWEDWKT